MMSPVGSYGVPAVIRAAALLLVTLASAVPAAADRAERANTAETTSAERLEARRAAVHDAYDARARELGRRAFVNDGDRAEAWRRLEDERRAALEALDRPPPTKVSQKR